MACRYTYQGKTYEAHEFDDVLRAMPIAEAAKYMPGVGSLPAAPFIDDTSKWLNLALKRVIKMAVDEGYDSVAFVNGEQSADRYDLSKQIERIEASPGKDFAEGRYDLDIWPMDSGKIVKRGLTAEEVEAMVGKELAKKIVESVNAWRAKNIEYRNALKVDGTTESELDRILAERDAIDTDFEGLDLKVGGEGMKTFYDRLVPQAVSALLKKMGGEGMTTVSIGDEESAAQSRNLTMKRSYLNRDSAKFAELTKQIDELAAKHLQQPGFTITPTMREKASGGMPLFSRERTETPAFREWFKDSKVVDAQGKPLVMYHATPRDFTAFKPGGNDPKLSGAAIWMSPNKYDQPAAHNIRAVPGEPGRVYRAGVNKFTPGTNVMPLYARIERPLVSTDANWKEVYKATSGGSPWTLYPEAVAKIKAMGYDGIMHYKGDELEEAAAFDANQVKSVFNGGTWGRDSPEILRSRERLESPEFKAWFKDSKVVDAQGRPLVVYHATGADFSEFDIERGDLGAHFGTAEQARKIAGWWAAKKKPGARTIPAYLSLRNPIRLEDRGSWGGPAVAPQLQRLGLLPGDLPSSSWSGVEGRDAVRQAILRAGYDGVVYANTREGDGDSYIAFRPEQIKSAIGNDGSYDETDPSILSSADRGWEAPSASKFDDMVYKMQDKQVDTKRVVESIKDAGGAIADDLNVYLQEELFHGRAAKGTGDFVSKELQPLVDEMAKDGLSIEDVDSFLHARHAREANAVIAQRNPAIQDGGSGMTNAEADAYFAELSEGQRAALESVAAKVDSILQKTRQMYVDYELESGDTVASWGSMFKHYVPLMREDDGSGGGMGTGQGFSIKGREVKSRTGSTRKVVDILANIALQRERAIVRGEKNRVSRALVGLAQSSPNKDFWTVDLTPTTQVFNPSTGKVENRADPMFKSRDNVVVAKIADENGEVKEHAVIFSERDERAMRMAAALKNLDAAQLEGLLGASASITRYFAAVNTQYNPVFGIVNLVRDVQGALINLQSTPLAGEQKSIAKNTLPALRGIYTDVRAIRAGKKPSSAWASLWEEFQSVGGQTGYRDMFATSNDRADAIRKSLDPDAWMDSKLGKIFTANGALKVPLSVAMKGAKWIFDWLSDYNLAMENGIRLATYKAGIDKGLSREQAASVAKNLTVNFNRKGQVAQQAGAMYAFFNASMQGTARLGQVLFDMEPGKPKTLRLSSLGKKVVYGGMMLGTIQALALAAAGFNDEDPPEFVRERSLIIPLVGGKYITIPMPLGLHVIPTVGRMTTEWALSGFKDTPQRAVKLMGVFADSFNPIGNAGLSMQTLAPTALDPLVALTENKDYTGKAIAKESRNPAVPGHALARDTATTGARVLSEAINYLTGGNEYTAGAISPTPDQIDYLVGQVTGGVGRELAKVEQTALSTARGEELPTYKVPLVGRFIGDAKSQASEGSAFYANTKRLNELETEIKGLQKDGRMADAQALRRSNSEAYLITQANYAERSIQRLRAQKSDLIKKGAPREEVRAIEEQITAKMAGLNRAMEALRQKEAAN